MVESCFHWHFVTNNSIPSSVIQKLTNPYKISKERHIDDISVTLSFDNIDFIITLMLFRMVFFNKYSSPLTLVYLICTHSNAVYKYIKCGQSR